MHVVPNVFDSLRKCMLYLRFLVSLQEMYVLGQVVWLFHGKGMLYLRFMIFCRECMFYNMFLHYFLLGDCSEAPSLTNPLRKGLITE